MLGFEGERENEMGMEKLGEWREGGMYSTIPHIEMIYELDELILDAPLLDLPA